jgi:diguanylate cyclase (GGDEF)-like protein
LPPSSHDGHDLKRVDCKKSGYSASSGTGTSKRLIATSPSWLEKTLMRLSSATIRFRLSALVCLCLLPVVLFTLYLTAERHTEELNNARQNVRTLARLTTVAHTNILAQSEQLLAGLAVGNNSLDDPLLGSDCGADLLLVVKIRPIYKQMVLARPDGEVYCAANPLQNPITLDDREVFSEVMAKKVSAHTGIGQSRLTGTKAITLAEPFLDRDGNVIAVLVAVLGLDWVGDRLKEVDLPKGTIASLVDSDGVILQTFPRSATEGKVIVELAEFQNAIHEADEGLIQSKGFDGIERVRAYAKLTDLPGRGVYFRVGFPKSVIDQHATHNLQRVLIGFGLIVAIATLCGWVGANLLVVRPLRRLADAAERLGKGDLAARTGLGHHANEIGQLAARFDDLASHVQHKTRALQALSAGNRLILRERDEMLLLQSMCGIAVEKGGYPVALVNYVLGYPEEPLQRMAIAGADSGLFGAEKESTWLDMLSCDIAEAAIRDGVRHVLRSVALDAVAKPWHREALKRGFLSIASFPMEIDGTVIGAFTLIAAQENAFDEDELLLLDEMAADLAFGIGTIRSRRRLQEVEDLAKRVATHDPLTGLPNMAAFLANTRQDIAESRKTKQPLTVLVVHLARLQDVYDTLGYEPGNLIVKELATRLQALPDVGGTFAKLGLEDFAISLKNAGARAAESAARSILQQCQIPVQARGVHFEIQAAVGASYFPGHGDEPDLLVRRATIAARDAARRGLSFLPYQGGAERENPERLAIAAELRQAIESRTLMLHYQPKVEIRSNRVLSCEALVRWNHPVKGMIPPVQFVPIAEQTGLIREMTYFVVEAAVRQQRAWLDIGKPMPIAVNLSVRNLYDVQLNEQIEGLLATWGIPPELIEFEITESALMEEPDLAHAAIARLRSKGSKIYIDDFGTGYSSLSYLVSLPVHALKIDRAFVVQMTKSREAHAVVASIISMAHELGLRVVAEGVETAEELAQLRDLNCDDVQGYYTGRPVPADEFVRLVALA